jgi:hypothetical protein
MRRTATFAVPAIGPVLTMCPGDSSRSDPEPAGPLLHEVPVRVRGHFQGRTSLEPMSDDAHTTCAMLGGRLRSTGSSVDRRT